MLDLTVASIPVYFATMGAEFVAQKRRADAEDRPLGSEPGEYERNDTITSLSMGVGSLVFPLALPTLVKHVTPGRGKLGKALVGAAAAAAVATTVADRVAEREPSPEAEPTPVVHRRRRLARMAKKVRRVAAPAAIGAGALAAASWFADKTNPKAQWAAGGERRDLGDGPLAWAAAIAGWDFIYYWNHRISHEVRALWAVHVIHHSSERYNLSTALRQPVSDVFALYVPYGLLSRLGIRPSLIVQARAINLLYQYWIHTEEIRSIGAGEAVLNTPSHHRVHHGSQRQYLDRNHGSILIVWDKLFGTFEPEDERVVYGLTKNIDTFNPAKVIAHEYADIVRDVAGSTNWSDRLGFVLRGPGWAYDRHRALLDAAEDPRADVPNDARQPNIARASSDVEVADEPRTSDLSA